MLSATMSQTNIARLRRATASINKRNVYPFPFITQNSVPIMHATERGSNNNGGSSTSTRMQRKCACGGSCPKCQMEDKLQPKLAIGAENDKYEIEADKVADQVMRMPSSAVRAQRSQRKASTVQAPSTSVSSSVPDGLHSAGHPMDTETRTFMESRFGRDFGSVRVHKDNRAAHSAQSIHAAAYTLNNNIVFGEGYYSPHTNEGRQLLAHELTHTIQQGAVSSSLVSISGSTPGIGTGAPSVIQRVGECRGKNNRNCFGSCIPDSGIGTGFCRWSGTIKNGCICIPRDQPMLRQLQQFMFDLIIAALITAGIVLTAAAVVAIIACLMGPCEVAALIAAVGLAAALIVIGIIESFGDDSTVTGDSPMA